MFPAYANAATSSPNAANSSPNAATSSPNAATSSPNAANFPPNGTPDSPSKTLSTDDASDWLRNSSFVPQLGKVIFDANSDESRTETDSSDGRAKAKKKKKKKEKKKEKRRAHREYKEYQARHRCDRGHGQDEKQSEPKLNLPKVSVGSVFIEDVFGLSSDDAFRIDRRGDVYNVAYQSLYAGHVAAFKRLVAFALGPGAMAVGKKALRAKRPQDRYFNKGNREMLARPAEKILELSAANNDLALDVSAVPLPPDKETTPGPPVTSAVGELETLGVHDEMTLNYVCARSPVVVKEEKKSEMTPQDLVRLNIRRFNEDLLATPQNEELWKRFVSYQDEAVPLLVSGMTGKSKSVSKEIVEKKQAILEKALLKNPGSLQLHLLQFDLQRGLWDEQRWRHGWKRVLFNHPNDVDLHLKYLTNFKSTVGTFDFHELLKEFVSSLASLRAARDGRNVTKSTSLFLLRLEDGMLLFVLHFVHVIEQAGYHERALACFQALIEFNLFRPDRYKSTSSRLEHEDFVAVMEGFWDSGVPRFGETNAVGWNTFVDASDSDEIPRWTDEMGLAEQELSDNEVEIVNQYGDVPMSKRWWRMEDFRSQNHVVPYRPNAAKGETEDDVEDPDRLVLFDDVKGALFSVHDDDSRLHLIVHQVTMLGLPAARHLLRLSSASHHHRHYLSYLVSSFDQIDLGGFVEPAAARGKWRRPSPSPDTMKPSGEIRRKLIRDALESGMAVTEGEDRARLAALLIRTFVSEFERSREGCNVKELKALKKAVKSSSQSVLTDSDFRSSPTGLLVWIQYAVVEWELGNLDDSRKVFDAAIDMFAVSPLKNSSDHDLTLPQAAARLALFRVRAELEAGLYFVDDQVVDFKRTDAVTDLTPAMTVILRACGLKSGNPADILIAKKTVSDCLQRVLTRSEERITKKTCSCMFRCNCRLSGDTVSLLRADTDLLYELVVISALLEAASSNNNVATESIDKTSIELRRFFTLPLGREEGLDPLQTEPLLLYEKIVCFSLKLSAWHQRRTPNHSLKAFGDRLWNSVSQFPDNAFLCRLFVAFATVDGFRLHRRLDSLVKWASSPMLLFAAFDRFHERFREQRTGTWLLNLTNKGVEKWPHSVLLRRQLFALHLAVGEGRGQGSGEELDERDPVVYLQHEIPPGAARAFYESLRFCPWAKHLYLDKLCHDPKQWKQVLNMLTVKNLRVRLPIEEFRMLLNVNHGLDSPSSE